MFRVILLAVTACAISALGTSSARADDLPVYTLAPLAGMAPVVSCESLGASILRRRRVPPQRNPPRAVWAPPLLQGHRHHRAEGQFRSPPAAQAGRSAFSRPAAAGCAAGRVRPEQAPRMHACHQRRDRPRLHRHGPSGHGYGLGRGRAVADRLRASRRTSDGACRQGADPRLLWPGAALFLFRGLFRRWT